ncbi:hypothetical protein F511_35142 [Dorcoceras hygrometricum]|uniref:Uncharacterized protein n=1 Tax=Dorcoceras hygrometricum TaxID=472368 RepID=A0A2Z7AAQ3_9LAMI|nr:hypothetical protein F511_35142 [Dorcoceras hygrometricum]
MASSLFINTLQVARIFGRYYFESTVTKFFSNATVIAGTVVSTVRGQKLVVMEEIFSTTFKLPTEGMPNFASIQNETIAEMRTRFSATENPRKRSQGYTVQISMLMELLVKVDLGASTKLHAKKVLTNKQVENYIKTNQGITPTGETSKQMEDTASNAEGWSKETQTKPVATQVTTPAPQTTATQTVENRGTVAPTNFDSEEDSETNSCPLVQRRCRKRQVSEPSDSDTTKSMPLTHFLKRRRTQRQHQQSGWTGVTIATQPDPIPASITEPEEIPDGHFSQGVGDDLFDENLEFNTRTEHGGRKEQEITTNKRDGSHHDSIPLVPTEGEGNIADNDQLDTGSHEPAKIVSAQNMQTNADPTSVDEYCQLLITSARNKVSAQLTIFEDWVHFRQEVRLKDISSFDSMVNIEKQLLEWGETEDIAELSERRSLILYKLIELELGKIYLAHLENFKTGVTSVNHDFECISRLHKELRLIAAAHRHYRELSLDVLSTRVSSLDLYFARLRDDTNVTRHHTTKLRDELKSTADGFDIKIDVLERTLTQRMVDELAGVKSQLAAIVEDLKETGAAKKGEGGGSSSRPREGKNGGGPNKGRGGSSSQGGRGRGRGRNDDPGDSSNRFRYTPWF